jgi:hypothetical protein
MTWWMWTLVALAAWLAVGFVVAWVFGHMARVGSDE